MGDGKKKKTREISRREAETGQWAVGSQMYVPVPPPGRGSGL